MKLIMQASLILGFWCTLTVISNAQDVTYTKDIAKIVYNKCTQCHRPGEIGPFPLTNYSEVSSYAATIKYVTAIKYMPPWKANADYQHYLDENYLTNAEIDLIGSWVDNGTPYGNASEEPSLPSFPVGSALGQPDKILTFAQSHLHKGTNKDEYRYFVLPSGLTEDKVLKAIELRPGNRKIVHHALFFPDTTGSARAKDLATPEYGYLSDIGDALTNDQFPGYVPGQKPRYFPDGMGQIIKKNTDLVIQMHYGPYAIDQKDSSSVNLFFSKPQETVNRIVQSRIMLPFDLPDGFLSFFILPNQSKTFHGKWTVNEDASLIGVFPHMHLIGTEWEVYVTKPDGTTENIIKIDDWDFNWQGGYYFKKMIVAPKGSVVHAIAKYNNTSANPNNPNNPPKTITWGENTTDEMYYLPLLYVPYKSGDENIVFGETTSFEDLHIALDDEKIYSIFPNPSTDGYLNIGFKLAVGRAVTIQVLDQQGKQVRTLRNKEYFGTGRHIVHLESSNLAEGQYFLSITDGAKIMTEKFIVTKH